MISLIRLKGRFRSHTTWVLLSLILELLIAAIWEGSNFAKKKSDGETNMSSQTIGQVLNKPFGQLKKKMLIVNIHHSLPSSWEQR